MAHLSQFDRWRLSRIAEEADSISFSSTDDASSTSGGQRSRDATLERSPAYMNVPTSKQYDSSMTSSSHDNNNSSSLISNNTSGVEEHIYSNTTSAGYGNLAKTDVHVGIKNDDVVAAVEDLQAEIQQSRAALKFMSAKYDSLGKVRLEKPRSTPTASSEPCSATAETTLNSHNSCIDAAGLLPDVQMTSGISRCVKLSKASTPPGNSSVSELTQLSVSGDRMHQYERLYGTGGITLKTGSIPTGSCSNDCRYETSSVGGNNSSISTSGESSNSRLAPLVTGVHPHQPHQPNQQQHQPHHLHQPHHQQYQQHQLHQVQPPNRQHQLHQSNESQQSNPRQPGGISSTSAVIVQSSGSSGCTGAIARSYSENVTKADVTPDSPPRAPTMTSQDLLQVEMFYSSHKSTVSVCPCLAGLYVGSAKHRGALPSSGPTAHQHLHHHSQHSSKSSADWMFVRSGLPVLILDSGESRRKRRLHVLLAERGTGFTLWRDTMDHLSEYTAHSPTFHTMCLSNDHSRVVGFSFDDASGAAEFLQNLRRLSSDGDASSALNLSDKKAKKKRSKSKESKPKGGKVVLNKAAISQPCCFTHVTKLDGQNGAFRTGGGGGGGQWSEGEGGGGGRHEGGSSTSLPGIDRGGYLADNDSRKTSKVAGLKHKA